MNGRTYDGKFVRAESPFTWMVFLSGSLFRLASWTDFLVCREYKMGEASLHMLLQAHKTDKVIDFDGTTFGS